MLWNGYFIVLWVFGLVASVSCFLGFGWKCFFESYIGLGWKGWASGIIQFQPPCSGQGHLSLSQVAQSPTQPCQNFMQDTGVVQTDYQEFMLKKMVRNRSLSCVLRKRGVHAVNLSGKSRPKWSTVWWPLMCSGLNTVFLRLLLWISVMNQYTDGSSASSPLIMEFWVLYDFLVWFHRPSTLHK